MTYSDVQIGQKFRDGHGTVFLKSFLPYGESWDEETYAIAIESEDWMNFTGLICFFNEDDEVLLEE